MLCIENRYFALVCHLGCALKCVFKHLKRHHQEVLLVPGIIRFLAFFDHLIGDFELCFNFDSVKKEELFGVVNRLWVGINGKELRVDLVWNQARVKLLAFSCALYHSTSSLRRWSKMDGSQSTSDGRPTCDSVFHSSLVKWPEWDVKQAKGVCTVGAALRLSLVNTSSVDLWTGVGSLITLLVTLSCASTLTASRRKSYSVLSTGFGLGSTVRNSGLISSGIRRESNCWLSLAHCTIQRHH